jgi:hypothetical protein
MKERLELINLLNELDMGDLDEELDFLPFTTQTVVRLNTGDAKPKAMPAYRLKPPVLMILKQKLDELERKGVIYKAKSPWASPVVMVKKPNGTYRMCVDYRQTLNAVLINDVYHQPTAEEMLEDFEGAKYFTCMDMTSGYHQLLVHPEDQIKTALITQVGQYVFRRGPMGVSNMPAAYQRCMNEILGDAVYEHTVIKMKNGKRTEYYRPGFAKAYQDDVICYSATWKEHIKHLRYILKRFKKYGATVNGAKCHFGGSAVKLLGYEVNRKGRRAHMGKVEGLMELKAPKTVKGVRSFVGFANDYRRHIRNFAQIIKPLTDLLQTKIKCHWGDTQTKAFDDLRKILMKRTLLNLSSKME